MLTREKVLVGLLKDGKVQEGNAIIYSVVRTGNFICAAPIYAWRVRVWDEIRQKYTCVAEFTEEDILVAVDTFISNVSLGVDFPDAHVLQKLNKEKAESEYTTWCEAHESELKQIAAQIYLANKLGKRTIVVDVRIDGTEGNYTRYLREHHFGTHAQFYSDENTEKKGLLGITISWAK